MVTHAANPIAEPLGDHLCRIYFSTRDSNDRSSIAWLEIDLREPTRVLRIADEPLLSPGPIGAFDDSGLSAACVLRSGADRYLYYVGWNLGVTVPWRNSIGLAISRNGRRFERVSPAPVLDRDRHDPFSVSYPWVMREGGTWRMWYGSNTNWGKHQQDMAHLIKYAESNDGVSWRREGRVAIPLQPPEYAISKPCVVRDEHLYRMWYSHRGSNYRIGYAESEDGLAWTRFDGRSEIVPSAEGWDSEAVCYACIFDQAHARYMLYNGNGYGRTGLGIAILENE